MNHLILLGQDATYTAVVQGESFLDRLGPGDVLPVMIVAMTFAACLLFVLPALAITNWRRVREKQIVANLIQDMLDRGMTAEEVHAIMSAWMPTSKRRPRPLPTEQRTVYRGAPPKPAKQPIG